MDKYLVEIEVGNDAMLTGLHVAQALRAIEDALFELHAYTPIEDLPMRNIRDYNGNVVGVARFVRGAI